MQVGTTKDQGLYNEPSAAVHPGALAAGTVPQYNKIDPKYSEECMLENSRCLSSQGKCVLLVDNKTELQTHGTHSSLRYNLQITPLVFCQNDYGLT